MNEKPVGTLYDSDVFVFNLEYLKHKEVSSYYDKSKPSIIINEVTKTLTINSS